MGTSEKSEGPSSPGAQRFMKQLCIVYNLTGFDARYISVEHWLFTTGIDDKGDADGNSIDAGQSFKFEITHDTDPDDAAHWWWVDIDFGDGTCWWSWVGDSCDLETRDVNSGRPVYVLLHPKNVGWSLTYPVSGACMRLPYRRFDGCMSTAAERRQHRPRPLP